MTKEQYQTLKLADLHAIAKQRGIKIAAHAKKADIIEKMLEQDGKDEEMKKAEEAKAREAEAKEAEKRRQAEAQQAEARTAAAQEPASASRQSAPRSGAARRSGGSGQGRAEGGRKRPNSYSGSRQSDHNDQQQQPERSSGRTPRQSQQKAPQQPVTYSEPQLVDYQDGNYREQGYARQPEPQPIVHKNDVNLELDSGLTVSGILEVMADGFGFIRSDNYLPGTSDVYVAPSQIRRFNLKTGDIVEGNTRIRTQNEKFSALLYVRSVNGNPPDETKNRVNFEDLTPIFPNERIRLERPGCPIAMRVMDLMCPVGKGQRGMIVSPPKAGKTTLLKQVATSVRQNNPEIHLIILLIDERPEEVTDIKEAIQGPNVEVVYSTFDELPEHHKRVAEMVIERAKRLVEMKRDVMILIDSITRLTRAYNITEESSGRTLSGGLDPASLHMPKRFFGAARNMREGGSLTILATALIETGSKMDDVVYEEFKGTGNMEMILNRRLSERRIFPAVDLSKSGTRRDDLLLTKPEQEAVQIIHRMFLGMKTEDATDTVLDLFQRTRSNAEFVDTIRRMNQKWRY